MLFTPDIDAFFIAADYAETSCIDIYADTTLSALRHFR
jgi:hypothetical protein